MRSAILLALGFSMSIILNNFFDFSLGIELLIVSGVGVIVYVFDKWVFTHKDIDQLS